MAGSVEHMGTIEGSFLCLESDLGQNSNFLSTQKEGENFAQ